MKITYVVLALKLNGNFYTLLETRISFKADKISDEDCFILTLFAIEMEARKRGIQFSEKDILVSP